MAATPGLKTLRSRAPSVAHPGARFYEHARLRRGVGQRVCLVQARQGEVVQLSREILAVQTALARAGSQAEADAAARQLADRHEARDAAIVQLGRLEEVQAVVLRQPGANERQVRAPGRPGKSGPERWSTAATEVVRHAVAHGPVRLQALAGA